MSKSCPDSLTHKVGAQQASKHEDCQHAKGDGEALVVLHITRQTTAMLCYRGGEDGTADKHKNSSQQGQQHQLGLLTLQHAPIAAWCMVALARQHASAEPVGLMQAA